MQFHQNLEVLRKRAKRTQKEIADILNTTQQQYSKYEKGQQELPIRHLITLADTYNITTDEVLGRKKTNHVITDDEANVIKMYANLTERRKGKIEHYLEQLNDEQADENAKNQETA